MRIRIVTWKAWVVVGWLGGAGAVGLGWAGYVLWIMVLAIPRMATAFLPEYYGMVLLLYFLAVPLYLLVGYGMGRLLFRSFLIAQWAWVDLVFTSDQMLVVKSGMTARSYPRELVRVGPNGISVMPRKLGISNAFGGMNFSYWLFARGEFEALRAYLNS